MKVIDFLPEIMKAMEVRLSEDEVHWGPEWLNRPAHANDEFKCQEIRILADIMRYYQQWIDRDVPIPWLKIIGNCMIAWIREKHPEHFPKKRAERIRAELLWCENNMGVSGKGEEFELAFIEGLKQAVFLEENV